MTLALDNASEVMDSIRMDILDGGVAGLAVASEEQALRIRDSFVDEGVRDGSEPWKRTSVFALVNRRNPPGSMANLEDSVEAGLGVTIHTLIGLAAVDKSWHTLVDTGHLRSSIHETPIQKDGPELSAEVVADAEYARDMDEGTIITVDGETFDVPSRPFMYFTEQDADRIVADVTKGLPSG